MESFEESIPGDSEIENGKFGIVFRRTIVWLFHQTKVLQVENTEKLK